jgi:hypothetical protein
MLKLWCIFDYDVHIYYLWLYFISYISTYYSIHNGMYIYVCVYIYILGPHFWGGKYHGETPPRYLATSWPRWMGRQAKGQMQVMEGFIAPVSLAILD